MTPSLSPEGHSAGREEWHPAAPASIKNTANEMPRGRIANMTSPPICGLTAPGSFSLEELPCSYEGAGQDRDRFQAESRWSSYGVSVPFVTIMRILRNIANVRRLGG